MDYSIIIPVFNKAALTRHCLQTLQASLQGAGEGEVIVVDNASSDETPAMLAEFPWVRVIRNEENRGFSGANNQGAAAARGRFLVLLNNDTEGHAGWLARMLRVAAQPDVGAVGARLLFPDGTLQHAGVVMAPNPYGTASFTALHDMYRMPGNYAPAHAVRDVQVVTGACLVTPRALYTELGGLDENYWNGYEDVDYCLKVREKGLRVVYDGTASLTHFESQSGPQRFRRVMHNVERLARRWNGAVSYDAQHACIARGTIRRNLRMSRGAAVVNTIPTPATTILCHGEPEDRRTFIAGMRANRSPIASIEFAEDGDAVMRANALMEGRGDRYVAFVDAGAKLDPGWLDALIAQVEFSVNTGAAAFAAGLPEQGAGVLASDARCVLIALRNIPAHLRLETFDSFDGSVADFLIRAIAVGIGTRAMPCPAAALPAARTDASFRAKYGFDLAGVASPDPHLVENVLRERKARQAGLVSIVMLSWNAPQFTKMALDSIRKYTAQPYEVVIVDNGSHAETVDWLKTLTDVRVIFNPENRGYAGGNNQALAAARGEYVVLLNNDVIVTEGWLDGLLSAFDRVPGLGVSAPRSNRVAGDQQTADSVYADGDEMIAYARRRRQQHAGQGYVTERAIGLCLCIDRRVIEEVGGIDERFGAGNFEDDDFCIRVRAAGYRIYVCDDVFIHHFGSQTFAANNVDWQKTMQENWVKFARKWGYPDVYPQKGYAPAAAIARGFDRNRHYVPLPQAQPEHV